MGKTSSTELADATATTILNTSDGEPSVSLEPETPKSYQTSRQGVDMDILDIVCRDFGLKIIEIVKQRKTEIKRRANEIRKVYSTLSAGYSEENLKTRMTDVLKTVPAKEGAAFPGVLRCVTAFINKQTTVVAGNGHNASPEIFTSPILQKLKSSSKLPPKPPRSKNAGETPGVFPSWKEMSRAPVPQTPLETIFEFVGSANKVPIIPKSKAPRLLKPGEAGLLYTISGSPVLVRHGPSHPFPKTEPTKRQQTPRLPSRTASATKKTKPVWK